MRGIHKRRTKKEVLELLDSYMSEGQYCMYNNLKFKDQIKIKKVYH